MENIILIVHLVLAVFLIVVVLLQRSEGGALGMGGGGGGLVSARGAGTALSKVTWILATAFIITSLTLTVIAATATGGRSVIEGAVPSSAPAADGDAAPTTGGFKLPDLPSGPTTPPAAD
ncbi:preprotein translocase subunit SecG [Pikeienuella sp. HZG-20]|uniref:preprotein translocase subunit SecG n=1 Tax=Paludibacillus litoralis TaxID=3133267 RepID=UPI0030EB67D6